MTGTPRLPFGTGARWTSFAGGLHIVTLITNGPAAAPDYVFFTTGTTFRIPDLGTMGVVLPGATAYSWSIMAFGPWDSVDAFAGGTGLLPTAGPVVNESFGNPRTFTTQ